METRCRIGLSQSRLGLKQKARRSDFRATTIGAIMVGTDCERDKLWDKSRQHGLPVKRRSSSVSWPSRLLARHRQRAVLGCRALILMDRPILNMRRKALR